MEKQASFDRTYQGDLIEVQYAGTFIHLRRLRPHHRPQTPRCVVSKALVDRDGRPILPKTPSMGHIMIDEIYQIYCDNFGDPLK